MKINKHFLGWEKAFLHSAVEWLKDCNKSNNDQYDFRDYLLLVPSKRTQRRVIELLGNQADKDKSVLIPPDVTLLSDLVSLFENSKRISSTESNLIWSYILSKESTLLDSLTTIKEKHENTCSQLAPYLSTLRNTLKEHLLTPDDILKDSLPTNLSQKQTEQWQAFSELWRHFEKFLESNSLHDFISTNEIKHKNLILPSRIVLVSPIEITPYQKQLLQNMQIDVLDILIFSPRTCEKGFDEFGHLNADFWLNTEVNISPDQHLFTTTNIELSDRISDIVKDVIKNDIDDNLIAIGAIDPELISTTLYSLDQKKIKSTAPGIKKLKDSLLGSFIFTISSIWAEGDKNYSELFSHPLSLSLLNANIDKSDISAPEGSLSKDIDNIWINTLSHSIHPYPGANENTKLRFSHANSLIKEFGLRKTKTKKPISFFSDKLNEILLTLVSFEESQGIDLLTKYPEYDDILSLIENISKSSRVLTSEYSAFEFYSEIKEILFTTELSPEQEEGIELLGWYELLLDDSPVCILAGCNEENLPRTISPDPFLPNILREMTGIINSNFYYARDRYQLITLQSRTSFLKFITAKKGLQGEQLKLSRLVHPHKNEDLIETLHNFYVKEDPPVNLSNDPEFPHSLVPPENTYSSFPLKSISASRIKRYLRCPYEFYLVHILGLDSPDFEKRELSPPDIGNIIHETCKKTADFLKETPDPNNQNVYKIALEIFDKEFSRRYEYSQLISVHLQHENIKRKLLAYAQWEEERQGKDQNWKIIACEKSLPAESSLKISSKLEIPFTGTIDRIDYNYSTNTLQIIDIKTSDYTYTFKDCLKKDQWLDPQLPLYAYYIQNSLKSLDYNFEDSPSIELCLLSINKKGKCDFDILEYNKEIEQSALNASIEVVNQIMNSNFPLTNKLSGTFFTRIFGSSGEISENFEFLENT